MSWILDNKEWLFSGVGVTAILFFASKFIKPPSGDLTNNSNNNSGNNSNNNSGNNSNNNSGNNSNNNSGDNSNNNSGSNSNNNSGSNSNNNSGNNSNNNSGNNSNNNSGNNSNNNSGNNSNNNSGSNSNNNSGNSNTTILNISESHLTPKSANSSKAELATRKKLTNVLFIDDDTDFKIINILINSGWVNTKIIPDVADPDSITVKEAHILFIDINGVGKLMGFSEEGLGLAKCLKEKYPTKKIIIYSTETAGDRFHSSLRKVDDFLSKNADPYEFTEIIEQFSAEIDLL